VANLPTKVIFDTNFLLIPIRFGVDIFNEAERVLETIVEFYITETVLNEIDILKGKSKPSFIRELEFAEKLAQQCSILNIGIVPRETVDDSLIRVAKNDDYIVATTDTVLRRKLREANVRVLYLRQEQFLELDGTIN
jgi:rRNA-processing protein FCF1